MAQVKVNPSNMITDVVKFSYVNVFEPQVNQSGVLKYSACLLLCKDNKAEKKKWDAAIEAAIQIGIAKGKFTANQRPILKTPIRDGDAELATEQKKGDEYKNHWFINCNANADSPPIITKPQGGVAVPILDPTEFFSGCEGRAIISFFPFDSGGSKGIAIGLNGAYKTGEGERLDGRVNAVSAFADFAAQDSDAEEAEEAEEVEEVEKDDFS
jgi:hypothetical protein